MRLAWWKLQPILKTNYMNQLHHLMEEFQLPLSNQVLGFSIILLIILLSPILLKKINIPGIIGLIISGVIIGPYGFNILEKNAAVDLFSTIGLLYIMFMAGLELDMNQFKVNRNKSFMFGFLTFSIPLALGYPVCHYILGYDPAASFLTASMFSTHTLMSYPIVSRMGIAKNPAVAITVGGTILTDAAVLIVLAVVLGSAQGNIGSEFWITLGISLVVFSLIMFMIVPRIAKWFFENLESEKHSHYIFVLAVVFFASFLAEVAGVEPIIGAFVAGLALNPLIPHSSTLMNRISFIGNSLFIPFFLISVGMLVDVKVIFSGYMAALIAISLSIVAIFGKWLAAGVSQLTFRFNGAQRRLIFGLSSAHAAATLAVILVGYDAGILDDNILNGTVLLILITSIVSSLATENAAKKLARQQEEELAQLKKGDEKKELLLLAISNLKEMDKFMEFGTLILEKKQPAMLNVLSVIPYDNEAEVNIAKARSQLEKSVQHGSASETEVSSMATIDHDLSSGVARVSKELTSDLILTNWPENRNGLNQLIGNGPGSLTRKTDKTIFIASLKSFVSCKRMVLITPPHAELEIGFSYWFKKMVVLAQELSVPLVHFGTPETLEVLKNRIRQEKLNVSVQSNVFADWEDFFILSRDIRNDDMLFFVMARPGSLSYIDLLNTLPAKFDRYFAANSKILVYPHQELSEMPPELEQLQPGTFTRGVKTVQRLGKGIGAALFGKKQS